MRTNHINARTDKTHQNSRCMLCGDRDAANNHIFSVISKVDQNEYYIRHYWMRKVIHWELYKKLKFNLKNKWYMYKPVSVPGNESQKLLRDFDIQTDHLVSVRRLNLIIIIIQNSELTKLLALMFRLTTERNRKKTKRRKSALTSLGNWKNCGIWK